VAEIVIGLGSNLDAPRDQFQRALSRIKTIGGLTIVAYSKLYDSEPLIAPDSVASVSQPRYLNAAIQVTWARSPLELLDQLLAIERAMGRVRHERWGPRVIDLDLLWSSDGTVAGDRLTLPHPELERRAFALAPLIDVAPRLQTVYGAALARLGGAPTVVGDLAG
jgi:2-amino-4-hydroxy-6-hydroxymethyldihydropteridine diphosphokinase